MFWNPWPSRGVAVSKPCPSSRAVKQTVPSGAVSMWISMLPNGSGRWVRVEPGGTLPKLVVNGREDEHVAGEAHRDCRLLGFGITLHTINDEDCGTTTKVAILDHREVSWINTLLTCAQYGITGARANHRCFQLRSADMGNDFAEYTAIVSFKVG
jgi:hypothetical protein